MSGARRLLVADQAIDGTGSHSAHIFFDKFTMIIANLPSSWRTVWLLVIPSPLSSCSSLSSETSS